MSVFDPFKEPTPSIVPSEVMDMASHRFLEMISAAVDTDLAGLERAGFMASPDAPMLEPATEMPLTPEIAVQSAQVIDLASRQQTPAEEMAEKAREMAQEAYKEDGLAA